MQKEKLERYVNRIVNINFGGVFWERGFLEKSKDSFTLETHGEVMPIKPEEVKAIFVDYGKLD